MAITGEAAFARPPTAVRRGSGLDLLSALARGHAAVAVALVAGVSLTVFSGGAGSPTGFEDRTSGSLGNQLSGLLVYLPALLFMLARADLPIRAAPRAWLLVALQLLILLSMLWAVEPATAVRRGLALTIETICIWHLATWFTAREFVRILSWTLAAALIVSLLAVALPGVGLTPNGVHAGKLRGVFPSKNMLGEVAGVAGLCFLVMTIMARNARERLIWAAFVLLALVELLLANSRTPLLSMVAAFAAVWAAGFVFFPRGWQRRVAGSIRATTVVAGALIVTVLLPTLAAIVVSALGRSMTLSGRTKIWDYAIGKGLERPWLGAGYKSFWNDKLTFDLRVQHEHWGLNGVGAKSLTGNAHNGYIDAWLELGFIGLAVVLLLFVAIGTKALRALRRTGDAVHLWHVGVLAFVLVYYITESGIFGFNDLAWFLVAYAFVSLCARETAEARTRPTT